MSVLDGLTYDSDDRQDLTDGRRRNFKQGWTRAINGQEYEDALDSLKWNNLGWRVGMIFGETPDELREEMLEWCAAQREATTDS
jgi:hypothetical protein